MWSVFWTSLCFHSSWSTPWGNLCSLNTPMKCLPIEEDGECLEGAQPCAMEGYFALDILSLVPPTPNTMVAIFCQLNPRWVATDGGQSAPSMLVVKFDHSAPASCNFSTLGNACRGLVCQAKLMTSVTHSRLINIIPWAKSLVGKNLCPLPVHMLCFPEPSLAFQQ